MPRLRLFDFRTSTGPQTLGMCNDNLAGCAQYVNAAQRRLVFAKEAGDDGWWGSFAEVAFDGVSRSAPFVTTGRDIARIIAFDVCDHPVQLHNQFQEYLQFGNGRLPGLCPQYRKSCITQAYMRNNVITFADQTVFPCIIRIYAGDSADINAAKRVLVSGLDAQNEPIQSQSGLVQSEGQWITITQPFADGSIQMNRITGIQKDPTAGNVQIFQVDPNTGEERLLLIMQPRETVAGYRRYYLNNLPKNCCNPTLPEANVRLTAIAKLELLPVAVDTDYLLIQNLEALIEECVSIRLSRMDDSDAKRASQFHHLEAIRMLNSEITHYLGKQSPAVGFHPFGSARLERRHIGTML